MLILLSPSKTQDFETPAPAGDSAAPALLKESETLIKALREYDVFDLSGLMSVSEKIAATNVERFKHFRTPFTRKNAKPAIFAFKGDVYSGFDAATLDQPSLDFAEKHLRILSGLYGALKPFDLIQPYRLEMKTKLKNPRGKDLYAFWGDRITDLLNEQLKELEPKAIINLASEEYFKAIDTKKLAAQIITPQFKEKKGSGYQMIGLFAKKARGAMARYICESRLLEPEALRFFSEDGYHYNIKLSTPQSPVYTRG